MTVSFHLDQAHLEVTGLSKTKIISILVDDHPLTNDLLTGSATGFCLPLPPVFFDGRRHRVTLVYNQGGGRQVCVFEHRSDYCGHVEKLGNCIRGYVFDRTRPHVSLWLEAETDGHSTELLCANQVYTQAPEDARNSGFILPLPLPHTDPAPHILAFRLKDTDYYPLGRILINIQASGLGLPDSSLANPLLSRTLNAFRTHYLLLQARLADQGQAPESMPEIWPTGGAFHATRQTTGIDVIVPVYKGYDETFACLESVLKARNNQPLNLIVINDKSPDDRLTRDLRKHAARHNYSYIENEVNLGFVGTVNKGMRLNTDNDVVLLNSDTEVADEWLDRLYSAAYSEPDIGSVSPLSNQATILNLPEPEGCDGIPYGQTLQSINDLCAEQNGARVLEVPTTHGFCMFIRRECLSQCGVFDEVRFGKGYGEENEFCLRSSAQGWRHVAALDAFVYHKNGVSFGQDKPKAVHANLKVLAALYPDYEGQIARFIHNDPMTPVRNRLQMAQWQDKPCVVFLVPSLGGGIDTHVADLSEKLRREGYRVLLAGRAPEENLISQITEWGTKNRLTYLSSGSPNDFYADILSLKPQFIHLHHLIDMTEGVDRFLQRSGIPYYITLHDYFYVSPSVTLLNEGEVYNANTTTDDLCDPHEHRLIHPALHSDLKPVAEHITQWHEKWRSLLIQARAVIAPDESVIDIYRKVFPDAPYLIRPHLGPDKPVVGFRERPKPETVRVAVLGTLTAAKGVLRLLNLARWAEKNDPDLRFVIHGYAEREAALRSLSNVEYHGPYTQDELAARLETAPCHVALFLSGWPETYSYTLTEALTAGLTPVCLDVGAFSTRMKALDIGQLLPLTASPADLASALHKASLQAVTINSYSEGSYSHPIADYYDFTPVHDHRRSAVWLPCHIGLHTDGWCAQDTTLEYLALQPVNRLKFDIYLPEGFKTQHVTISLNGQAQGRFELPPNVLSSPVIITRPLNGRIYVTLRFDYARPLSDSDPRTASARLTGTQFDYDAEALGGKDGLETPESVRELQALYTDVTRYALSRERETVPAAIRGGLSDLFWATRLIKSRGAKGAVRALQAMRYLRHSSFDTIFYSLQQQSTRRPEMDAITHYVTFGADEGLDPAPGFSTRYYLQAHDDIARSGINPFYHYLRSGLRENRRTEPSDRINLFMQTRNGSARLLGALRLAGLGHMRHVAETLPTWPKRDLPDTPVTAPNDMRPDDAVLDEATAGEQFLKTFGLLGRHPHWAKAVDHLNTIGWQKPEDPICVSIIVPVYGQLAYTLNLLDSLLRHDTKYSFEILIGDDASPDQSGAWLGRINGVSHIRYEQNEGFIANCNKTAAQAQGKFIVLLNNDTRVCAGWLDGLIDSFERFPDTGLVGSKLLYPDGSLQEAGGIVWQDGSAWNYGRNDDPNRPEYCHARPVDYISGASIALRTEIWNELGGFDSHYRPAYYEDTDMAFRLRAAGYKVIMQPTSRVVHYEGKSSGTDTSTGVKAYQLINHEKFYTRWKETLSSHRQNGEQPERERNRTIRKHVLILDAVNPRINQDAGSNATRDLFLYYQALGYSVSFLPEDNFLYEPEYVIPMQAMGIEALYAPYVPSLSALLSARQDYYDVIHLIRPAIAHRNLETIKRLAPNAKIAYLNADLHYLRMERQSVIENRPSLRAEAAAMKTKELALTAAVDMTFVHSSFERDLLQAEIPDARIHVMPLIDQVVINDTPHSGRMDVLFLGGYNHPPNLDAARWILQAIWPELSQRLPQARLLLIGANPPQELKDHASDRVIITGRVDDLSEWFDQTRVCLAPLRYGAGAKGKLIAAMGHGVPTVATSIAVEGLDLPPDAGVFVAEDAAAFIQKTVGLYRLSAKDWKALAGLLQQRVRTHHSFDTGLNVLEKALK